VSNVRSEPLTPEEIAAFKEQGFLFPIRVLDDDQVEETRAALDDHLEGRRSSHTYELTDPILAGDHGTPAVTSGVAVDEKTEVEKKPHSVPFLFNLWERDDRFWKIASNPVIAGMARQLLGSEEVVLMEDRGRGQALVAPGLLLLAADDTRRGDVLDRARRCDPRERRHAGRGRLAPPR
jgi:hypothetical protein